ncbi:hypothetical protein IFM89_029902 [Coptis chinensis]|uniref:Uncharacterized protein n=1 Tax=Coptis chinensis TaxID=261450 RepID=A0A835HHZ6_9MAGN|nr:hypothetical protein IFM89_029902 [Coptis chinensis]
MEFTAFSVAFSGAFSAGLHRILMNKEVPSCTTSPSWTASTRLMLVLKILPDPQPQLKLAAAPHVQQQPLMFFRALSCSAKTRNLSSPSCCISSLLIKSTLMLMGLYCHKGIKINNLEIIDARGYNRSLISSRVIEAYLIKAFADEIGIPFMETSAKSSTNSCLALRYEALILREKISG